MAPKVACVRERLMSCVNIVGDCWIWAGLSTKDGYPVLAIRRKQYRAHRISFEVFNGRQCDGFLVCHSCDTPLCINPAYLFLGTPKDNTADMISKGRKLCAVDSNHGNTKIPHKDRSNITSRRSAGETLKSIASSYGVSIQTVSAICLGRGSYDAANT